MAPLVSSMSNLAIGTTLGKGFAQVSEMLLRTYFLVLGSGFMISQAFSLSIHSATKTVLKIV